MKAYRIGDIIEAHIQHRKNGAFIDEQNQLKINITFTNKGKLHIMIAYTDEHYRTTGDYGIVSKVLTLTDEIAPKTLLFLGYASPIFGRIWRTNILATQWSIKEGLSKKQMKQYLKNKELNRKL